MTKITTLARTSLRMPQDVYDLAVEAASESDRSLNNFIVQAVREKLRRGDWLDAAIDETKRSADDGK